MKIVLCFVLIGLYSIVIDKNNCAVHVCDKTPIGQVVWEH